MEKATIREFQGEYVVEIKSDKYGPHFVFQADCDSRAFARLMAKNLNRALAEFAPLPAGVLGPLTPCGIRVVDTTLSVETTPGQWREIAYFQTYWEAFDTATNLTSFWGI